MSVVTIKINGMEYNLKGDEQEEYLHRVAGYVDKKVRSISENNPKLSTSSAAVLSAVNAADDMFKMQRQYELLKGKLKEVEEQKKLYEDQMLSLKKQLNHMEQHNSELVDKLKNITNSEEVVKRDEAINSLKKEMEIIQETGQKYLKENTQIKAENKEMKFQLQSSRYKIMDLQNKLVENQIDLVKEKKRRHPLINDKL